ncbi:FAD-dependent oxidoreductase [Alteromonas sp. 5E99-2]|uniref:flavin monoamine oxidase family protein n=1 Tax=Alteromonas sp. 5E99-2 TaxID=2817683 RepID=UPI001A982652|nr:FAD-dependent oxidoreductase [Alteromonas sp. 5E99-2]MBO1255008.1 FAD-dependent oxidoreductase [Alteromonas sp. 5E99-2]
MQKTDVVIIGAGLSGLYSAMLLKQNKVPYLLLEAKHSVGGRITSTKDSCESDVGFDLGPTWIFPHQQKIQHFANDIGIALFQQYIQGDALFQRPNSINPERFSGAGGMPLLRVKGGMSTVVTKLLEQIDKDYLRTNHKVYGLKRLNDKWQVSVDNNGQEHTYESTHIILALPPRMITRHLSVDKWASDQLVAELNSSQTWMSAQAKFVVSYKKPFWRENGLSGQAFSQVVPLVEMHDASLQEHGDYALFGFIGLDAQQRKHYSEDQLKTACLQQLCFFYGDVAKDYQDCEIKDWAKDQFVASPLDCTEPSKHPSFNTAKYSTNMKNQHLYFAGSEFSTSEPGYLEGAIQATEAAISQLLDNL